MKPLNLKILIGLIMLMVAYSYSGFPDSAEHPGILLIYTIPVGLVFGAIIGIIFMLTTGKISAENTVKPNIFGFFLSLWFGVLLGILFADILVKIGSEDLNHGTHGIHGIKKIMLNSVNSEYSVVNKTKNLNH
jgi:hypothetical protein